MAPMVTSGHAGFMPTGISWISFTGLFGESNNTGTAINRLSGRDGLPAHRLMMGLMIHGEAR